MSPDLKLIRWVPAHLDVPVPEVHELHGDEALSQWLAAHASMYFSQEERQFAATAATPLVE